MKTIKLDETMVLTTQEYTPKSPYEQPKAIFVPLQTQEKLFGSSTCTNLMYRQCGTGRQTP